MVRPRPTDDELRQNFDEELASASSGGGLHTETGLDSETQDALWAVARAYPEVTDDLLAAARTAFAGQLDGSHAAGYRDKLRAQYQLLYGDR
ncbi:hypothetical protein [Nocardia sp. BMG51109]|uniref:hypothetical protein n=1 Tax=Nocardia sp. BMG51109 TaxID=1056816 RepID=UPI0004658161|nr:hypothetical protein [Nocardia sp. BMG51109]